MPNKSERKTRNLSAGVSAQLSCTRSRRTRVGAESDLVDRFLLDLRFATAEATRVTIFREPRILSGFPDLVAVRWHSGVAAKWRAERAELADDAVRLLHYLTVSGASSESDLRRDHFRRVRTTLDRLVDLDLVHPCKRGWRAAPLHASFAVRSIVAFEAKISDWSTAIEQAALNRWFASESYVLAPKTASLGRLVAGAIQFGVGVWIEGAKRPVLRAKRDSSRQPLSYASWLFNEWAWRDSLAT
jgi:hypothetical protein